MECRADVVQVGLQPADPPELVGGPQERIGLLDQCADPRAVPALGRGAQLGVSAARSAAYSWIVSSMR